MIQLSVIIITFNEEKNIGRCLDSVRGVADEIVVVDSFSEDRTREICLEHGVRVVEHSFEGYIEQKNYALGLAAHPYVLSLDADEAMSETLRDSILEVKSNWLYDGYVMNRVTSYCGQWIRHGSWYPDRKLRLFDRRKSRWGGQNPHDKVVMNNSAKTARLRGDLLHYSFYSIAQHLDTMNNFSTIKARIKFEKGIKPRLHHFLVYPRFRFFRDFVVKGGFRDGFYGYVIARNNAYNVYLTYAKLRTLWRERAQ